MSRCLEDVENDYVVICLLLQNTTTISFLLFLIAVNMGCLAPIIPYQYTTLLCFLFCSLMVIRKFMLRFEQPTFLSFCCFCKAILLEKTCFVLPPKPKGRERERERLAVSPLPCSSLLLTPLPLSYLPLRCCARPHFTTTLIIKAINRFFLGEE